MSFQLIPCRNNDIGYIILSLGKKLSTRVLDVTRYNLFRLIILCYKSSFYRKHNSHTPSVCPLIYTTKTTCVPFRSLISASGRLSGARPSNIVISQIILRFKNTYEYIRIAFLVGFVFPTLIPYS